MSCETGTRRVSLAGLRCGLSSAAGRAGYYRGQMAGRALRAVEAVDGPRLEELAAGAAGVEAAVWLLARQRQSKGKETAPRWLAEGVETRRAEEAALFGKPFQRRQERTGQLASLARRRFVLAAGGLQLVRTVSGRGGTALARLSREGEVEERFFFPRSSQVPARLWQSRLTPVLNRLAWGPGRVVSSGGLVVEVGGQAWHRGELAIDTPAGRRTVTCLQSLSVPGRRYYFSRRLSDNETVGIIAGQKGFAPKQMEGYVGQVSEVEALAPAWAQAKLALIRAAVHGAGGEAPAKKQARTELHREVGDRVELEGRQYPVLVRRVLPAGGGRPALAEAVYYDEQAQVWRTVEDEAARRRLAAEVQAGRLETWEGKEIGD